MGDRSTAEQEGLCCGHDKEGEEETKCLKCFNGPPTGLDSFMYKTKSNE